MLRLLADENFNGAVFGALRRQAPALDIVRAQDVGLQHTPDPLVLEWAANERRVLLTHDQSTVPGFAYDRVRQNRPMAGVIELLPPYRVAQAVEDIRIVAENLAPEDVENQVIYLPL